MIRGFNVVMLMGNIGDKPEMRIMPSGIPVAKLSLATKERWVDDRGMPHYHTDWHRLVLYGKMATAAHQYLGPGRKVYVRGKLQSRSWKGRDGTTRHVVEVIVRDIQYISSSAKARAQEVAEQEAGAWEKEAGRKGAPTPARRAPAPAEPEPDDEEAMVAALEEAAERMERDPRNSGGGDERNSR